MYFRVPNNIFVHTFRPGVELVGFRHLASHTQFLDEPFKPFLCPFQQKNPHRRLYYKHGHHKIDCCIPGAAHESSPFNYFVMVKTHLLPFKAGDVSKIPRWSWKSDYPVAIYFWVQSLGVLMEFSLLSFLYLAGYALFSLISTLYITYIHFPWAEGCTITRPTNITLPTSEPTSTVTIRDTTAQSNSTGFSNVTELQTTSNRPGLEIDRKSVV